MNRIVASLTLLLALAPGASAGSLSPPTPEPTPILWPWQCLPDRNHAAAVQSQCDRVTEIIQGAAEARDSRYSHRKYKDEIHVAVSKGLLGPVYEVSYPPNNLGLPELTTDPRGLDDCEIANIDIFWDRVIDAAWSKTRRPELLVSVFERECKRFVEFEQKGEPQPVDQSGDR
jgi:hypothetical protein